jgi:hypothetical protein
MEIFSSFYFKVNATFFAHVCSDMCWHTNLLWKNILRSVVDKITLRPLIYAFLRIVITLKYILFATEIKFVIDN